MSAVNSLGPRELRQRGRPTLRNRQLAALFLGTAATMAVLVLAQRGGPPWAEWATYLALIPVVLVAYASGGPEIPLMLALFFSSALLPATLAAWRTPAFGGLASQFVSYLLFLALFGYLAGSIAGFLQARRRLGEALREREALLARTTDLHQVIVYLLRQARAVARADKAVLLMLNPVDGVWQAVRHDEDGVLEFRPLREPAARLTLAEWLVDQGTPRLLGDLEGDLRFVDAPAATSLLAEPLRLPSGALLAMLVLINDQGRRFRVPDLRAVEDLAAAGAQAMVQAGVVARTDQALALEMRRLAATQRAARALNASLAADRIVQETLAAALDVSGAAAGLAAAHLEGLAPVYRGQNASPDSDTLQRLDAAARGSSTPVVEPTGAAALPALTDVAASRMLVPIRREQETLGFVVLESAEPEAFGPEAQRAVVSLADQAAIALENARLYAEILREKQVSEQILTSIADALLTLDGQGRITAFNPAAEQLTGWRGEEAIGHSVCDVLACTQGEGCREQCRLMAALAAPQVLRDDLWSIHQRGGNVRTVTLSAAPLPPLNGVAGELVVLLHDITERHEVERFQRNLIAAFSHELRTPLATITAIADILLEESDSATTDQDGHLHLLKAESARLAEFAGKMLDATRFEGGRLRLETRPVPVGYVVANLMRQWQAAMPGRPLRVDMPPRRLWVWADEKALETILSTLVDNANKYSPARLPIELAVAVQPPGYVTVAVRDQGPGIPAAHRDRIFERFYRVEAGDTQTVYGYGLGLYFAHSLVEAMGGEIWVDSEEGQGSCFCFTLPVVGEDNLDQDSDH